MRIGVLVLCISLIIKTSDVSALWEQEMTSIPESHRTLLSSKKLLQKSLIILQMIKEKRDYRMLSVLQTVGDVAPSREELAGGEV